MLYASEGGEIHRLKKQIGCLLPTLREFDGKKPIALLTFLSQLREGLNALGVSEAAAVRVIAFLLAGDAKSFYDSVTMSGTRSRTVTQTYTWPYVVHSLIDRYLTDTELQNSYDRVTLIAQRTNEDENEYADRIAEAALDCANVFEELALVNYYVRGLLETTRERVTEDLRRLPEKERHDLTAVRRLGMAQGNKYRAQVAAVAKAASTQSRTRPRTPTVYITVTPMIDGTVPPVPGFELIVMLSNFRNDRPDYAYEFATGLESILFLGTPGTSTATTVTTTNSREITTSVGVDLNEAPVNRDTTRTPQLTEDQIRKAFSIIPNDYWQLNCRTCPECGHSTFTCPTLTPMQRMYFAYQYYLDQVHTNPSMETFLAEKTQRRIDLARERQEGTGMRTHQPNNVTYARINPTTHPKSILSNPNPRPELLSSKQQLRFQRLRRTET